jgi:hypothetical protein
MVSKKISEAFCSDRLDKKDAWIAILEDAGIKVRM